MRFARRKVHGAAPHQSAVAARSRRTTLAAGAEPPSRQRLRASTRTPGPALQAGPPRRRRAAGPRARAGRPRQAAVWTGLAGALGGPAPLPLTSAPRPGPCQPWVWTAKRTRRRGTRRGERRRLQRRRLQRGTSTGTREGRGQALGAGDRGLDGHTGVDGNTGGEGAGARSGIDKPRSGRPCGLDEEGRGGESAGARSGGSAARRPEAEGAEGPRRWLRRSPA